jgi:maltose O-acetyltransferase
VFENAELKIGNNVSIGHNTMFNVKQSITIGNDVAIGGEVMFFDNPNHLIDIEDPAERLILPINKEDCSPIKVGDGAWISTRCIILKGVSIGKGAVIGINSTVVDDVPEYTLVAGCPAKFIKKLKRPEDFKGKFEVN